MQKFKLTKLVFFKVDGLFRDKSHGKCFFIITDYADLHRCLWFMFICENRIEN